MMKLSRHADIRFSAWAMNFTSPKVGNERIFEKMNAAAILNTGDASQYYASGQFIGKYRDLVNYYHSVSDAGYKSYFIRIPEHKLSVAIFSNLSTFNPASVSLKIVDIVLEDQLPTRPPPPQAAIVEHDPSIFKPISSKALEPYTGSYWSEEFSYKRDIQIKNDTLVYYLNKNNTRQLLSTGTDNFKMVGSSSDIDVTFSTNDNNERMMTLKLSPDERANFVAITQPDLQDYMGNYFSEELRTFYHLVIEGEALVIKHQRMEDIVLDPVSKTTFLSDTYFLSRLDFVMDEGGEVIGFKASNGRVKDLWFGKR